MNTNTCMCVYIYIYIYIYISGGHRLIFYFFLPITVNYSKNIVQITACPPY